MALVEREFRAMGTVIRLVLGPPAERAAPPAGAMAALAQRAIVRSEGTLSRVVAPAPRLHSALRVL